MARLDRQPYVVVFVHEERMLAARRLAATLPKDQQAILNAVLCPPGTMDTVDEYGYLPNVKRSNLLPKR